MSILHSVHIVLLCCTSHDIHHAHPECAGAMAIEKFSRQELFLVHVGHKFPSTITYTKLKFHYHNSKCFDQNPRSSRGCVPDTRGYKFICIFQIFKLTLSIDVQPCDYSHLLTGYSMKIKVDYIKNSFVFKQNILFKIIMQL
jgi:hypothetical protein